MDRTMSSLLIFAAGCLTGASITFAALKKRFEERMEKEREAEREFYEQQKIDISDSEENASAEPDSPSPLKKSMEEVIKSLEELQSKTLAEVLEVDHDDEEPAIYPITADEYGANGFDQQQLYFYAADETLADEEDNVVEPDSDTVGEDAIDIFVYTDAESCYIRNTETETDYEILRVEGTFDSCESGGSYG